MTGQAFTGGVPVPVVPPELLRRRTSVLTRVTMAVLGVGALLIAVLVVVFGGPVAAVVTTLLAAISFPVLILILFWLDRYEPEPARYRLAALGWGGVVAVAFSLIAEGFLFAVPGTSSFVDTGLVAGTTYRYRVRATDASGNTSVSPETAFTASAAASPSPGPTAGPAGG